MQTNQIISKELQRNDQKGRQKQIIIFYNSDIINSLIQIKNIYKVNYPSMEQVLLCDSNTEDVTLKFFLKRCFQDGNSTPYFLINPNFLSKRLQIMLIKIVYEFYQKKPENNLFILFLIIKANCDFEKFNYLLRLPITYEDVNDEMFTQPKAIFELMKTHKS